MELNYDQAMNQLSAMFADLDTNTIRNVLASNHGDVEPTIDELLKIQSANEHNNNDDNMFANNSPQRYPDFKESMYTKPGKSFGSNNNNGNSRGDSQLSAQEQKDIELAYQLQKKYIEEDQAVEQYMKNRPQTAQQQPGQNNSVHSSGQKKEKKGFMQKLTGGIKNIFDKKGKGKGPTKHAGAYSNIEHLGDEDDGFNFHGGNHNDFQSTNSRPMNGIGHNQQAYEEEDNDAPMQLDDILGPNRANSYNEGNNNREHGNYGNHRSNSGTVNRDHFGY